MSLPTTPFNPKTFLASTTDKSGVYCMLDSDGIVLYVGKAKNLKKRLASYFNRAAEKVPKTKALVAQIAAIEVNITHTEADALILENTLIKKYQPRYNILLRDDKSYPYLYLSDHPFPRLSYHRGAKRGKGRYFGPYPDGSAVHDFLNLLPRIFPVRQCKDSFFRNRSRPCLQYQIKRCTAPCVGLIDAEAYQQDVKSTILFLQGKSQAVIDQLAQEMQAAAQALQYERAAKYRDQIQTLQAIHQSQYVSTENAAAVDIVAAVVAGEGGCVQIMTVRDGRHLGSRAYFPKYAQGLESATELLTAFLPQYYLTPERDVPSEIVVSPALPEAEVELLAAAIGQQVGKKVYLHSQVRSIRARWVEMTIENAQVSLAQHRPHTYRERLAALTVALQLESLPRRLACFDISHTLGEATVASCVVFDEEGARNSDYRRFNITGITAGDDYAAMEQALTRHYQGLLQQAEAVLPDILFIDGGKGQVKRAQSVLQALGLLGKIRVIGVAKGAGRKAGLESLILLEQAEPLLLPPDSPALHLIQHIRDEAHRFAITAHRIRRDASRRVSTLEGIEGIGKKRRQQLLNYFGGLQAVSKAGVADLAKVPGISRELAQKIYDFFAPNDK